MFWDRRRGERRDQDLDGFRGPERRRGPDRRQWTCGILYRTARPAAEIERWLERNASGRWQVMLEDVDDNLGMKVLKLMFENEDDKYDFIEAFEEHE